MAEAILQGFGFLLTGLLFLFAVVVLAFGVCLLLAFTQLLMRILLPVLRWMARYRPDLPGSLPSE